jgi:trigger factor
VLEKKAVMKNAPEGALLANGQHAIIDFTGIKPDGSRPDNMKGTGYSLEIGSHSFVDTFEEQLIGMKVGDERTIEVTFPGDYGAEELRNVKVKFEVKLQEIKDKVFPEIDDEFLKEEGHADKAAFLAAVRRDLEDGQKKAVEQKLRREVLQRLSKENNFLIPNAMIDQQLKADQDRLRQQYKAYRLPDSKIDDLIQSGAEEMRKTAEAEMREALIVNRYAEDAKIEVGDADIDVYLKEVVAKDNGGDISYYEDLFKKHPQYKTNVKIMLREQKAVEAILKKVKIS